MRVFCLRFVAFLLLQVAVFFLCLPDGSLRSERNYLAATIDKHRLLKRTPPPRIIVLGGSNVPFGIRSGLLERELGRPVVNMGLVAGLGLEFMLNEVAGSVREGDWVLLSPEHDLFDGGSKLLNQQQILEYRPASLWHLPFRRAARLLDDQGLTILGGAVRRALDIHLTAPPAEPDDSGYSRGGFNQWGDYVAHYGRAETLAGRIENSAPVVARPITTLMQSELARFARRCQARGARCFYTCPPHPRAVLQPRVAIVEANIAILEAIPGLEVLDHSSDHLYEPGLFYDTGYHLTEAGARQRTETIIRELKRLAVPGSATLPPRSPPAR
jgi:hypothetical protein